MRILFSPDDNVIKKIDHREWGVDKIILPAEIDNYNYNLPENVNNFTIFIPTIINQDFALNYDGVELAIHLYFQLLRRSIRQISIVLLGIESCDSFMKNYAYPKIIKCPGFDYILLNKYYVVDYSASNQDINEEEAYNAIEALDIKLPDSYRTSHSFVNEWCFYKWSEYMNFDNCDIKKILAGNLYFDYLSTIQKGVKTSKVSTTKLDSIKELEGKVLLIDDNPIWHKFFEDFFNNSGVEFKPIGIEFKNLNIEEIVKKCETTIRFFDPDIVLLDFRLNEDKDFDVKSRNDISGVKVLKAIKGDSDNVGCAFGTRVLMFTATGKIEHVLALQHLGADGFIFKEHPQKYVGKSSTKESVGKVLNVFDEMLSCAPIAKSIVKSFNNWDKCIQALAPNNEISLRVSHVEKVVRTLMNGNFQNLPILKLIYLECFSILENLKDGREDIYPFIDRLASKIGLDPNRSILWQDINSLRNALAHGYDTTKFTFNRNKIKINETIISEWLINLCDFIFGILDLYCKQN